MNIVLGHRLQLLGSAYVVWALLATLVTMLFAGQAWNRWQTSPVEDASRDGVLLLMSGVTMVAMGGAVTRGFMAASALSPTHTELLFSLLGGHWVFLLFSAAAVVLGYSLHLHTALKGTQFEMHPCRLIGLVLALWAGVFGWAVL